MKQQILFALSYLSIVACQQPRMNTSKSETTEISIKAQKMTDSIIAKATSDALFDTLQISNAPVKVLRAKLVEKEYSSYRDISLTFKNTSEKIIDGIKFRWYGENVFGEPADMGSYGITKGFGGGFTDKRLRPGQTLTLEWNISSQDGRRVIKAWPIEIVFEDGSKWVSSNN